MSVEASIDAVNRRDRRAWLAGYADDVRWDIVDGPSWSGREELDAMWDSMVDGGVARHREVTLCIAGGATEVAVIAHDGVADGIVVCQLDAGGRIRHGRSYRTGGDDPTTASTAVRRHAVCWNARDRANWLAGFTSHARIEAPGEDQTIGEHPLVWDDARTAGRAERVHPIVVVGGEHEVAAHLRTHDAASGWIDWLTVWRTDADGRVESLQVLGSRVDADD